MDYILIVLLVPSETLKKILAIVQCAKYSKGRSGS